MIRLDPGEELLFSTRRHPLPALGGSTTVAALGVLLALVTLVADPAGTGLAVAGLLFAATAVWFGIAYLRYRRDIVVVTTRRLVHRSGLLAIKSSETAISRIGDILINQGVLGRALDYGDVKIVAGSESGIDLLHELRAPNELSSALRRGATPVR
jgi:membrane protein YdbS with pleckstrin-like domain